MSNIEMEEELKLNEGGSTKNPHKYIVAHHPRSSETKLFISRGCFILFIILSFIMIFLTALITYLLLGTSCSEGKTPLSHVSNGQTKDDYDLGNMLQQVKPKPDDVIIFHKGWSPFHYDLTLEPDIESSTSNGSVTIWAIRDRTVEGLQPIVIDITEIEILSCKVNKIDRVDVFEELKYNCKYGDKNESYVITIDKPQYPLTNVTVELEFISKLTSTLQGFYKGSYNDSETNENVWFVSTQFSPIDARRAFPCFDNPGKKATFKLTMIRPVNKTTSIANMPVAETITLEEGLVKEVFEITPKMSTYLLAFHVSDLVLAHESNSSNKDLPKIKVWTRKELVNSTDFGYDLTASALPFFEDYFGIKFRLPKIDLVAVPDFGFSAMENWGLITYRESAFLVSIAPGKIPSASHMRSTANTIVHETAHQWFGNLVTMKWYDDLWLKEGFSTYLSYVAVDKIKKDWNHFQSFSLSEHFAAMAKDSDVLSHPISFPVRSQSDVRRVFDPISYSKGAVVINMMRGFLGESTFREGLKKYLKKFEYGNAVQDDLWEIMTEQAHQDETLDANVTVKEIMDTWTLQAGYPVINVTRDGNDIVITQERYMLPYKLENDTTKYFVPISFATAKRIPNNEIPDYWLKNTDESLRIENVAEEDEYVYLNLNRTGYYRINYDALSWKNLIFSFDKLPQITRAQLVDDAFNLARANIVEYDIPLTFSVVIMKHLKDDLTWWSFYNSIESLTRIIRREPVYGNYQAIMKSLFNEPYESLGFDEVEGETHSELLHRSRIVKRACEFGVERCVNRAQILFRQWMTDALPNGLPENLKETIICHAIAEGGVPEWNYAYEQYLKSKSVSEKEVILSSLGCTKHPWLLSKYLNMTVDPTSGIRKQDGARAFTSVVNNAIGLEVAFDHLFTNLEEIYEYFGNGFSVISKMIDALALRMNKHYHKDQFTRFALKAQKLGFTAVEKSINLASIEIDKNIYWMEHSYEKFNSYLEKFIKDLHINTA